MNSFGILPTLVACLVVLISPWAATADNQGIPDKLNLIIDQLERIETQLQAVEDRQMAIEEELDAPSTTATFCTSQGNGIELGADLAAELKIDVDLGVGWPNVGSVKLVAAPSIPAFLPIVLPPVPPLFMPIPIGAVPIPTEVKVGLAGGMGRSMDFCIEIPVHLSPEDQDQLLQLAEDIDRSPVGFEKSKFQRRGDRLLNYVARHVPGIQVDPDVEVAFDRAEAALQDVMDNGLTPSGTRDSPGPGGGLDVFRDGNIRELLASLDIPISVASIMNDPEQIFDALPDLGLGGGGEASLAASGADSGFDGFTCDTFGLASIFSQSRPNGGMGQERLSRLCGVLENDLPRFDLLRDALADFPGNIVEAVGNLFQKAADVKSDFCSNHPSRIFNLFCGR